MPHEQLLAATQTFFSLHWPQSAGNAPIWQKWEPFLEGSVPFYKQAGCYALYRGEMLDYVGLGMSRGGGLYPESGLSRRLMSHVYQSDKIRRSPYLKLRSQWHGITALSTIGFEHQYSYLAPALEQFLIRELRPPRNKRR